MHLQIYIRGVYSQVELFKSMAQNVFFKWRRTSLKTGKEEIILVQMGLRPSLLGSFELIFPETALAEALAMMGLAEDNPTAKHKIKLLVLRKLIGLKKIPKAIWKEAEKLPESIVIKNSERGLGHLKVPGVWIHAIGIKKDEVRSVPEKNGKWGYTQEML